MSKVIIPYAELNNIGALYFYNLNILIKCFHILFIIYIRFVINIKHHFRSINKPSQPKKIHQPAYNHIYLERLFISII